MPLGSRLSTQTLGEGRSLHFLPRLFTSADPHAGFSSQNLGPKCVSKINSFDFANETVGFRCLLLSWMLSGKSQSKWFFPSLEAFFFFFFFTNPPTFFMLKIP